MKKAALVLTLILVCLLVVFRFQHDKNITTKVMDNIDPKEKKDPKSMSKSENELRLSMRMLWESRAILLRAYIVSALNASKDAREDKKKLLKNAGDLGASIQPYYGYFARHILTGLLKKDVIITGQVIKAAKENNVKELQWAKKKWRSNLFQLACFFYIARNQTKKSLVDILYKHLDLTWAEIDSILKKDVKKDFDYYEKDRVHMLMFSDVLTDGIVKQFPEKFKE